MAKSQGQTKSKGSFTVARVAGKPIKVELNKETMTVKEMLAHLEIELAKGEQVTRDGAVLKENTRVRNGDIILIEENDDNG